MSLPLSEVRVLSVEQYGAGPWGTLQLADLGAEVIKIEDPGEGGDVGRYIPPYQTGTDSLFFESFNRNKKSLTLDLRNPESEGVFHDLVRNADVVFSNLRGDLPARLGITYEALKEVNPRIVCCSLSGFGMTGPKMADPAYDYLIQGMTGWMAQTGAPDDPPTKSGLSLVDLSGGYVAAIVILAALHRARRDNVGCDCDVSLMETALAELMYVGTWVATHGYEPPRQPNSAHPSLVPFQNFQTSDGWIVIGCAKEKFWRRLCKALDRPGLISDPQFRSFVDRDLHRDKLLPILDQIFLERTTPEWIEILVPAGVPVAPINTVVQALEEPQVAARNGLIEFEHPTLGSVREVASPLRIKGVENPVFRGPLLAEHTIEVLGEVCGYSADRIRELIEAGAVSSPAALPDQSRAA